MAKEQYYVQVGLRKNGKIVKAENFSPEEFAKKLYPNKLSLDEVKTPSFWKRLSKDDVECYGMMMKYQGEKKTFNGIPDGMPIRIRGLTDKDTFGKKKRK